jgi:hypothetical protein
MVAGAEDITVVAGVVAGIVTAGTAAVGDQAWELV